MVFYLVKLSHGTLTTSSLVLIWSTKLDLKWSPVLQNKRIMKNRYFSQGFRVVFIIL